MTEIFLPFGVDDECPITEDYRFEPIYELDVFLIKLLFFLTSNFDLGTLFYLVPKFNCDNFY